MLGVKNGLHFKSNENLLSSLTSFIFILFIVEISSWIRKIWHIWENESDVMTSIHLKVGYQIKMVFCYQNCSDWEKIVLVIEKNFWNSRLKAENLKIFWDH